MNNRKPPVITASELEGHLGEIARVGRHVGLLRGDRSVFYLERKEGDEYSWMTTDSVYRITVGTRITLTRPRPRTFEYTGK